MTACSNRNQLSHLIELALAEDLRETGDMTANLLLSSDRESRAAIISKQDGILFGLDVAKKVFEKVDSSVSFKADVKDGDRVSLKSKIAEINGSAGAILTAERTALNFLQRLSGIATLTAKYVQAVAGTKAKILDTRKTTPAHRFLEKMAVRAGGGFNHRFGLFDMVLIKENHIEVAGNLRNAVAQIHSRLNEKKIQLKIEVETKSIAEVEEVSSLGVDRIMLDNMSLDEMQKSVQLVNGKIELEASGGVTLATVRSIAETGVDYISVGALTHSAPTFDLSLLFE